MYLFQLIEEGQEIEDLYGPMTKVFIKGDDDDIIEAYHLVIQKDEEQVPHVVIE